MACCATIGVQVHEKLTKGSGGSLEVLLFLRHDSLHGARGRLALPFVLLLHCNTQTIHLTSQKSPVLELLAP